MSFPFVVVQFPEMAGFIHGEESNKFENGLGKYNNNNNNASSLDTIRAKNTLVWCNDLLWALLLHKANTAS